MNFKLRNMVAATLAGTVLMGFGTSAMADSTFDLVQALVAKGVLTEEEALPLLKGREADIQLADKKVKKAAKLSVSDAVDNATLYGDMRVREEYRTGKGIGSFGTPAANVNAKQSRNRYRGKMTLGVKTEAGAWYSDLALAVGSAGRTDNFTFGGGTSSTTGQSSTGTSAAAGTSISDKPQINLKRAMIGFKATDWLTVEAGLMANPLYTTPMVWDADLTVVGLAEKITYPVGLGEAFGNLVQMAYTGDRNRTDPSNVAVDTTTPTNELLAFQGGYKYPFSSTTTAKAALTYYYYTHGDTYAGNALTANNHGVFTPKLGTDSSVGSQSGVNNLQILEIPAEVNWMVTNSIGVRAYGDYAVNLDADARANAAALATPTNAAVYKGASGDDAAWLLGIVVGSANDLKSFEANKLVKGDWQARIWYQDVGVYSLDPNTPDSDFMDSRVNMKGVVLKGQYNFADNVALNAAYGHATRKNDAVGAVYAAGNDIGLNLTSFDLFQLDLTYKF